MSVDRNKYRRGTETLGIPAALIPPGQVVPNAPPATGTAAPASGAGQVSITLRPTVGDVMTPVAGNTATLLDLSTLNGNFQGSAWSFPGASGDNNNLQWCDQAVPVGLSKTPNLRARVHFIIVS